MPERPDSYIIGRLVARTFSPRAMSSIVVVGVGMVLGTSFGVVIGVVIGAITGDIGMWIALGIGIGVAAGLAIGVVLSNQKKRPKDQ